MTGRRPDRPGDGRPPGSWHRARAELAIAAAALAACAFLLTPWLGARPRSCGRDLFGSLPGRGQPPSGAVPGPAAHLRSRRAVAGPPGRYQLLALADGPHRRHRLHRLLPHPPGPGSRAPVGRPAFGAPWVSLYHQPGRARTLLRPRARDLDLWPWVDPQRPLADRLDGPGIPARRSPAWSKGWNDYDRHRAHA